MHALRVPLARVGLDCDGKKQQIIVGAVPSTGK
jgi:hypothetical protein